MDEKEKVSYSDKALKFWENTAYPWVQAHWKTLAMIAIAFVVGAVMPRCSQAAEVPQACDNYFINNTTGAKVCFQSAPRTVIRTHGTEQVTGYAGFHRPVYDTASSDYLPTLTPYRAAVGRDGFETGVTYRIRNYPARNVQERTRMDTGAVELRALRR